jgi:hypothetical protein
MLPALVIVFLVECFTVQTKNIPPVLRLGQSEKDFIQLPDGIMDDATSQFTICTWAKKRFSASSHPRLFHYEDEIRLSDNALYDWVMGNSTLGMRSEITDRGWFHTCWTWSTLDYTFRVFFNGDEAASVETIHRKLGTGRRACIGNSARFKRTNSIFGGDLYNFKIYKRVLKQAEIRILSMDMCNSADDTFMVLTWDDVLKNKRNGSVTEIPALVEIECNSEKRLRLIEEQLQTIVKGLGSTSRKLNSTEGLESTQRDLHRTNKDLTVLYEQLERKLNSTQKDLEGTNKDLTVLNEQLERKLNSTQRDLEGTNKDLTVLYEQLERKLNSTQKDLEGTNEDLNVLNEQLERKLNSTQKDLEGSSKDLEGKLNSTLKDLERTNKHLTVQLDDMMANLKKSESKLILYSCFT